jgi:hypothetical protein
MNKYYADQDGNYVGAYNGATPPVGSVDVGSPPSDARQKWNGSGWDAVALTVEEISANKLADLASTDSDMPRIVEDMWQVLIDKGLVVDADLPQVSQDKLANRRSKRAAM